MLDHGCALSPSSSFCVGNCLGNLPDHLFFLRTGFFHYRDSERGFYVQRTGSDAVRGRSRGHLPLPSRQHRVGRLDDQGVGASTLPAYRGHFVRRGHVLGLAQPLDRREDVRRYAGHGRTRRQYRGRYARRRHLRH